MESPDPRLRILAVDDDPPLLQPLVLAMERAGHSVASAHSGTEALRLISEDRFDVLLTDWLMPGVDGIELTRRVRDTRRPPAILLMSSLSGPEARTHAIQAGADEYLPKPIDAEDLLRRLAAYALGGSARALGRPSMPPRMSIPPRMSTSPRMSIPPKRFP